MDSSTFSPADLAAVSKNADDGFLGGGGIFALIIIFILLFSGGFGGYGGNGAAAVTQADLQRGFDTSSIVNKLDNVGQGICSVGYENARLQDNTVQVINSGIDSVNANITSLGYQMRECCCDLKTQMLQDKYEAAQNDLNGANMALAQGQQTQYLLAQLGRYYTYPAMSPCTCYTAPTTTTPTT